MGLRVVALSFGVQSVEYLVFDEADRLFEMGFAPQLREILTKVRYRSSVSAQNRTHIVTHT